MERYGERKGGSGLDSVVSELWIISLLATHSNPETFFLILNLSFFNMISILECFVSPLS